MRHNGVVSSWRWSAQAWCVASLLTCVSAHWAAAQAIESQASPGRPFGVAAVSFPVTGTPTGDGSDFFIAERNARIFYPVFTPGRLARLLAGANEPAAGSVQTVLFLFTGNEPLELVLHAPQAQTVVLRPQPLPQRGFDRLMTRWWREYYTWSADVTRRGDYPPLLETYLTGMLGQRLNLRPPLLARVREASKSPLGKTMDLILATEDLHLATMRRTMASPRDAMVADQPVPSEIELLPPNVPPAVNVTPVEEIARHVPEECFYVRFGNFENYLWMEDLLTSHGGDISRMVSSRGQDPCVSDRVRRQLSLPDSALAKVFGGQLIADVALIGRDVYLQEGAAVGVLFHAHSNLALSTSFRQHRSATLQTENALGATLENLTIGGREVSFLSTPDNQLRSFYAVDGDFHLVTTSRRIIERFLEVGKGQRSLGDSAEFQFARAKWPLERNDTIFAFLSTAFFQGLIGPQYQIELQRRIQAVTDLELVQFARLAAANEGYRGDSMESWATGGFLPVGFGRGVDGSGPILEAERAIDSLRGARGTFTPIPDIELRAASSAEIAEYSERSRYFAQEWRQLDPLAIAIKRTDVDGEPRERLTIEANISPLAEDKYGWLLSLLGPPVTQRIARREGDVISLQAFVTGGQLSNTVPPHLLFLGVRDTAPAFDLNPSGLWQMLRLLRTTPGYLGAWPKPGFVDWLPLQWAPTSPDGYARLLLDVWRWQGSGFSVLSFQRPVLDAVVPQLRVEESEQPAQIRLHVGDLSQSQLRDWLNWLNYQKAREISVGNVRLIHSLSQQLRVPEQTAKATMESLLNTHLLCPLGGTYECNSSPNSRAVWRSTAWSMSRGEGAPADYQAPLLKWLRGLDLSVTKLGNQIEMRADVDMRRDTARTSTGKTLLDLFRKTNSQEKP